MYSPEWAVDISTVTTIIFRIYKVKIGSVLELVGTYDKIKIELSIFI